jgi:hypothetical protein
MVLESKPFSEVRIGQNWHIGNISSINTTGLYFRLGRTSTSTIETYDDRNAIFIDQEFETAPYTHVVLDLKLEVCAIAKKTKLSNTTIGIARQLIRLLNDSKKATELRVTFEIDELKDPEDFISQLKQAYLISRFTMSLSRPNAFDANEDFVKPFQEMVKASDGEKGKAEVKGKGLNPKILEELTRSAAATGEDASARLQTKENERPVTKRLKGSTVTIAHPSIDNSEEQEQLLKRIRSLYEKIRGKENK